MKIKRTIAAIMALVLVGGAYPYAAENTKNIGKVYAVDEGMVDPMRASGLKYELMGDRYFVTGLADETRTDIVIPDEINGIPVGHIEYSAFRGTSIKSVVMGANVEHIGAGAFLGCTELTSVDLANVKRIDVRAFMDCRKLTEVKGGEKLEYINDDVFNGCLLLSEFNIGENVRALGTNAFSKTNINVLVIPENVGTLYGCPTGMDTSVYGIPHVENTIIIVESRGLILNQHSEGDWSDCLIVCHENSMAHEFVKEHGLKYCTFEQYENGNYEQSEIPELDPVVCLRKYGMYFKECEGGLEVAYIGGIDDGTLVIPDEVAGIPVVKCDFSRSDRFASSVPLKVEKIVLGKNVKTLSDQCFVMFMNLKSIEGSESLETIGSYVCAGLRNVEKFDFGNKLRTIGSGAFTSCAKLKSLTFPDSLEKIDNTAFAGCTGVESIEFGSGLKYIGNSAFGGVGCTSLEMPENLETIGNSAFCQCYALKSVKLNDRLTTLEENAFSECVNLREVNIPSGITELKKNTFYKTNIAELEIPANITTVGKQAFTFVSGDYKKGTVQIKDIPDVDNVEVWVYNADCDIADEAFAGFDVLYGYSGSTAETFMSGRDEIFRTIDEVSNEPSFTVDKDKYKYGEIITLTVKNIPYYEVTMETPNLQCIDDYADADGNHVYKFKSINPGFTSIFIDYAFENKTRSKEITFEVLDEDLIDENYPVFTVDKDEYKYGEIITLTAKNIPYYEVTMETPNLQCIDDYADADGNHVYKFKSINPGFTSIFIDYAFENKTRSKEITFEVLDEDLIDENYPDFSIDKDEYKYGEIITLTAKNIAYDEVTFVNDNLQLVDRYMNADGSIVYKYKSVNSGMASILINYEFENKTRSKEINFEILDEDLIDENYPDFSIDKTEYKYGEIITLTAKNIAYDEVSFVNDNLQLVDRYMNADGSIVYKYKSLDSGMASIFINYEFENKTRSKEINFEILDEDLIDENYPDFSIDKTEYKYGEIITLTAKNIAYDEVTFVNDNLQLVDRYMNADGSIVYKYKSVNSGMASILINYEFENKTRSKEINFEILDEDLIDENYPDFSIDKTEYKYGEIITLTAKNIAYDEVTFVNDNLQLVDRYMNADGSIIYKYKSVNSGMASIFINYEFENKTRSKEINFEILDEDLIDENYPDFSIDKTEYKYGEIITLTAKNIAYDEVTFVNDNLQLVDRYMNADGSIVYKYKSLNSGMASILINYKFENKTRSKEINFEILDEDIQDTGVGGDANCDGDVDMSDVVLIMQALANPNKYGVNGENEFHITQQGIENSDVDTLVKGLTVSDALRIQRYLLGLEETL